MTARITWVLFVLTVVGANWAFTEFGTVAVPFGLEAPAGVYFAGIAFGLRDILHEAARRPSRALGTAIAVGAVVSYMVSDSFAAPGGIVPIAVASALAFGFSETADWSVYAPLRSRSVGAAALASNTVGAAADSVVFLWLAFGSIDGLLLAGQVVGKVSMTAVTLPVLYLVRRRWLAR